MNIPAILLMFMTQECSHSIGHALAETHFYSEALRDFAEIDRWQELMPDATTQPLLWRLLVFNGLLKAPLDEIIAQKGLHVPTDAHRGCHDQHCAQFGLKPRPGT